MGGRTNLSELAGERFGVAGDCLPRRCGVGWARSIESDSQKTDRNPKNQVGGNINARTLVAEFIGTFALVLIGAGAVAVSEGNLVATAFAHGLTLMVIAYAYGHISGAHINPVVTVGLWADKQIESASAVAYIVVQVLGGIVAAAVLALMLGGTESGLGATRLDAEVNVWQGLLIETILNFFLVNAIYNAGVSGKAKMAAGAAIGLTLTFAILMGGPLTGASLNPARTIGPDVVTGDFSDI
ncbi:MAG: aquaporin [Candidatus Promineifilaceae bacterium]